MLIQPFFDTDALLNKLECFMTRSRHMKCTTVLDVVK